MFTLLGLMLTSHHNKARINMSQIFISVPTFVISISMWEGYLKPGTR